MKKRGLYVVFDGMDGSGKGTQLKLLREVFDDRAVFTYEPGGTPFADKIRELVRNDPLAKDSTPLNNLLLFFAAREDLMHHVIMPALEEGKLVFSDRGYSSTYAYQLCGEGLFAELLEPYLQLRMQVYGPSWRSFPDAHIIYDLPAEEARARVFADSARDKNHFDEMPLAYYERVREGFLDFARAEGGHIVDATLTPEMMHAETLAHLARIGVE